MALRYSAGPDPVAALKKVSGSAVVCVIAVSVSLCVPVPACRATPATLAATQPALTTETSVLAAGKIPESGVGGPMANRVNEVVVLGRGEDLVGVADNASDGYVGGDELARRPILRPAEILEAVPGLVITQHSGPGKANQYFLRGFQLDHGTDFAVTLSDVPQNLPSHAHGQGYLDLNYLIPELVSDINYRKGPYSADVGDFSSAGSADIHYVDILPRGIASFDAGSYGYARAWLPTRSA